jgi:hypothetical protein
MSAILDGISGSPQEIRDAALLKNASGLACNCRYSISLIPLALVVIGALGAAGFLTPIVTGAVSVVLGGLGVLGSISRAVHEEKARWVPILEMLLYAAAAIFGALLLAGVLPLSTVSYFVIAAGGAGLLTTGTWVFIRA